jgi:hypothetical protein
MPKLTNIIAEIYADEAIEEILHYAYDDPVIGFNQFTAKEIVKMYHDAVVVNKPKAKTVKAFKKFPCEKGLCHGNVYFGSKLMKNYKCMKGFAHDHGSWKAHSWAIHRGNIIETTPVKRNAYYGIPIKCDDLEKYVQADEKKKFDDYMKSESLTEATALGDCYEANAKKMMEMSSFGTNPKYRLVHGMPHGQGPLEGIKFGHCWFEDAGKVYDYSNGKSLKLPKKVYYALGKIDKSECHYYTWKQVSEKLVKYKHWGPWDMSGDEEMVAENIPDGKSEIGKPRQRLDKDDKNWLLSMLKK